MIASDTTRDAKPVRSVIALRETEKEKLRVAKTYNKKVRLKDFQIGDLV